MIAGPIQNPANGHHYYLLATSSWTDAEEFAKTKLHAHLATVNDADENSWIANTFRPLTGADDPQLWIGFNDAANEGEFVWCNGESATFSDWYPGEPSNTTNADAPDGEDYTAIRGPLDASPDASWNDLPNDGGGAKGYVFGVVEIEKGEDLPPVSILAGPIQNPANGHDYYLLSASSWTKAERFAKKNLHAHLATVNDADENSWIANTFRPLTGKDDPQLWIGLNDRAKEGHFVWTDHEPVSFTYWFPGEPSNTTNADAPHGEDAVAIRGPLDASPDGSWNDFPDDGGGAKGSVFGVVEVQ